MSQRNFRQKVVMTGGAGGIGRAIARRFLDAGAIVVLGDVDQPALDRALAELMPSADDDRLGGVQCDVSRADDCRRLVESAEAFGGGPIDVFIANAGVPFGGSLADSAPDQIQRVIDVNVVGSILSAQAALPSLERGTGRCLLFMGSLQSVTGRAGRSVYTASKHAIAGLVKSLALELGPLGVRVNAIAPTVIDTPFLHQAYQQAGVDVARGLDAAARALPLGRIPTPDDVAQTAMFLASSAAGAVTGQVLLVDCGASAGKF